ncbi:thioredoxin-dependent thiol peroxidase [Shewanella sedimentimangrovi]|uniref:thioredoxin-dependent peroxiredoxin n=1 Tax=Shewanella sedimentimangrovi TaxID=2814293 RepID=A0ABX7R4K0_9GAMM|nr:thioredoxin-dependent thiol peroxidase [Shewanella sedimentimangrovi]QSX38772.1 thioredoxin-dependent thiol peroxidase [Shewanella sedimentimangrovi]
MSPLQAGAKAPEFTLKNQAGVDISLAQCLKQGPVLVYFYPKALTPGCTVQACGLRDSKAELDAKGVTVLGISPDPVAKLAKFEQKHELNFHLLSDEDHAVADAFGVWGEKKFMGKVYDGIHRLSFLINQDGTVHTLLDKFKTKDHHQAVLALL